jgi:hypothetical protein
MMHDVTMTQKNKENKQSKNGIFLGRYIVELHAVKVLPERWIHGVQEVPTIRRALASFQGGEGKGRSQ